MKNTYSNSYDFFFLTAHYTIYCTAKKPKLALSVFLPHKRTQTTYKHNLTDMDVTFSEKITDTTSCFSISFSLLFKIR